MFRRQTQQTKPNTGIKSFSSRVERRKKAVVEEKKEEPAKPVAVKSKNVKKVVPKAEDLPDLKDSNTAIKVGDIENIYATLIDTESVVVIVIKPIVGPKDFSEPIDISGNANYVSLISGDGNVTFKLIQREVTVYNTNEGTTLFSGAYEIMKFKTDSTDTTKDVTIQSANCTIERLNIINKPLETTIDPETNQEVTEKKWPVANTIFKQEGEAPNTVNKIEITSYQSYVSYKTDHTDVKKLYFTNKLYIPSALEDDEPKPVYNVIVSGEIPQWVYDEIHVPESGETEKFAFKINDAGEIDNAEGTITISTVNGLPGTNVQMEDNLNTLILPKNLGDATNGQIDIRDKFDNFYVNNVTVAPHTSNDIITRFTQTVGTGYLGSNVTIKAAGGAGGIVDDKLLPLIRNVEFKGYADDHKYNEVIFTIKPNEKQGLLVENRENVGSTESPVVPGHIIIDLSSNETFSNALASWVFVQDGVTDSIVTQFTFVQEAVILNGKWNDSSKPDVRLNKGTAISEMTIKYYKDGAVVVNNLVPNPTQGSGNYTLDKVNSIIDKLYLVNGTVEDVNVGTEEEPQTVKRLLDSSSVKFAGKYTEDNKTPQITKLPIIEVYQENEGAEIKEYYTTNMIVGTPNRNAKVYNNVVVFGTMPNWTISSELLDSENGYGIKATTTAGTWDILPLDSDTEEGAIISTVNFLPVDGYGEELDIGVDFSGENGATLGDEEAIELPEATVTGSTTKINKLELLNFNVNVINVNKTQELAQLDVTATLNHSYEGATILVEGGDASGITGTASPMTDLISGFEVSVTTLTIKIKPSDKKNILKDYRKGNDTDANKKEINLDITGNLNLCNSLVGVLNGVELTGVIIEQEALILDDSSISNIPLDGDLTFKGVDITMNESVEITTLKLKYLKKGTDESYSEEELSFTTTGQVNHIIDEFYFVHGTISNERLFKPLSATDVFTEDKKVVLEDVLVPNVAEKENEIALLAETIGITEKVHLTNIINGLEANGVGKSNVVVNGEIPKWAYDDFVGGTGITVPAVGGDNSTPAWTLSTINDFPCKGYGELDIGINGSIPSKLNLVESNKTEDPSGGDSTNNGGDDNTNGGDENTGDKSENSYGKDGFYVNKVTVPQDVDLLYVNFTSHSELVTRGSDITVQNGGETPTPPPTPVEGDGYIKIKTLDQLYNLMMQPRTYVADKGILFKTNTTKVEITNLVMEKDYYLYYLPTLTKGKPRLQILKQLSPEDNYVPEKPKDYVSVMIMAENITDDQETEDTNDDTVITRIYLQYKDETDTVHIIPYGVVGNGPFYGSELDPKYEVDGNKWNLKIEDIMKGINERQVSEDSLTGKLELSIESLTDEEKKIKKSEMYEYICEIKRTLNAMPFNSRYLNEILGYLSKCLAFEQTRLPSIRESDNQGLESVNEEYDAESNPNGWIEKYTEEFEKNGIVYKVVEGYENYKFKEGGKHDDLIKDMKSKLAQIYMFGELGDLNNLDLDGVMNKLVNGYVETWMKYYKGLVIPNDLIMSEYSDIEIYEDERIYKVFEGNSEEGTHVISQLTDGNASEEEGEELKTFIESIMKYFKDEINEITGTKKEIKGITIEDMVAYEDPLKETTTVNAEQDTINQALTNNENNLIEYSQMLSTIQGERNKLQRQGNKNKIILKFTQTVKGTFFELLGKERMNTDLKSQIFGFFLSELKEIVNHTKKNISGIDRKSRRGVKSVQAIPEEVEGKRYLRITKIPEFYVGDPLDWINDSYYSNKIFLQNCDNLYVGIDPELDPRIEPIGTPVTGSNEFKEQEMIGYYILKIQY